jgi:hypothetical protein
MDTDILMSQLRPDPCKDCPKKEVDDWGLVCDLACGKASAHDNYKSGAKDMLKYINDNCFRVFINKERIPIEMYNGMENGTYYLIPEVADGYKV